MATTETLHRPLDCVSSDAERWTMPAGYTITVYHFDGPRWAVVLDGRVYRAEAVAVLVATS